MRSDAFGCLRMDADGIGSVLMFFEKFEKKRAFWIVFRIMLHVFNRLEISMLEISIGTHHYPARSISCLQFSAGVIRVQIFGRQHPGKHFELASGIQE